MEGWRERLACELRRSDNPVKLAGLDWLDLTRAEEGKVLRSFDRRRSLMWAVALAALGAFAWIVSAANVAGASSGGIAGYSGNPATSGGATTSTAATSASAIYSSMCADCHGANGQGGDGPSLQVSTMSTSELQWIIANGVGGMPYYSRSLSSSEISGLASFTRGMQIPGATTSSPPTGGAGPSLKTSTMSTSAINTIVANGSVGHSKTPRCNDDCQ